MTMPIGLALLFLMAVAPVLPWRKASGELLRHRLLWPAWIGTGCRGAGRAALGQTGLAPLLAYGLAGFAAGSAGRQLVLATRRQGWRGLVGRANGGMIVHIGVVLIAVAFAASASNVRQAEFTLKPGRDRHVRRPPHHLPAPDHRGRAPNKIQTSAMVLVDGSGPYAPGIAAFRQPDGSTNPVGTPSMYTTPKRRRGPQPAGGAGVGLEHGHPAGHHPAAGDVAVDRWRRHRGGHRAGRLPGPSPPPDPAGVGAGARAPTGPRPSRPAATAARRASPRPSHARIEPA